MRPGFPRLGLDFAPLPRRLRRSIVTTTCRGLHVHTLDVAVGRAPTSCCRSTPTGGLLPLAAVVLAACTDLPSEPSALQPLEVGAIDADSLGLAWGPPPWIVQSLGSLPGTKSSRAEDISDNRTVAGFATTYTNLEIPFYWTQATGMQALSVPRGTTYSRALAISDNGTYIAGVATNALLQEETMNASRVRRTGPRPTAAYRWIAVTLAIPLVLAVPSHRPLRTLCLTRSSRVRTRRSPMQARRTASTPNSTPHRAAFGKTGSRFLRFRCPAGLLSRRMGKTQPLLLGRGSRASSLAGARVPAVTRTSKRPRGAVRQRIR